MASRKKPVGRTPIGSPSYLRRIDPIWVCDRVPFRFWQDRAHRRDYLLWLGYKLRFRWMEDWYKLTHEDIKRHHGGGLASNYWNDSAIQGVKECFPDYDWHDWLFAFASRGFWKSPANRRRYLQWLGRQLGYRRPEDWYQVTLQDFVGHKGGTFLLHYKNAVTGAVMACFPEYDWKPWLFHMTPNGFWDVRNNRLRYLKWLGQRLGYRRPEDWYAVKWDDFVRNHGLGCVKCYHASPPLAAMDLYPDYPWLEWKFPKAPYGFWQRAENRRRYVRWLGEQLGFRRLEDWHRVRRQDFLDHHGGALLFLVRSHLDVLQECLPGLDLTYGRPGVWKRATAVRSRLTPPKPYHRSPQRKSRLSVARILRWADKYRRRNGYWPDGKAGFDEGCQESWTVIDEALRRGRRGFPGGSSVAKLLARYRGVHNIRRQPRLTIGQILRWADQHHRRTGKWPNAKSGPVTGTTDCTWSAIVNALRSGYRGLPKGQTLPRLLAERRGVRNHLALPLFRITKILNWAKRYCREHGRWPTLESGPVAESPGDTWSAINSALDVGNRGLPGGQSLSKLLKEYGLK